MASDADPLAPLLAALGDLTTWLKTAQAPGVIIGGVAASLLGRPRVTRDIDALVMLDEAEWMRFLTLGQRFGFEPRRPDAIDFARQVRVLLVQHAPSGIDIDIVFGALPFEEEVVANAISVDVAGIRLSLPTPEDLIIMKAVAHRPRDLGDIEAVLDTHPELDTKRVRRWVREFSMALAMPALLTDLEKLLKKR
ncbi:MAG: hypothetical protein BMS9Abin10_0172 [Gammaproteobacteria bacterium]|nr:MAG: hypothetical protein BMS9Abin10_0172 [Gammaproteobacteria bacterium]